MKEEITITRKQFKELTDKLLKEELDRIKERTNDPIIWITVSGMSARTFTQLECELFR